MKRILIFIIFLIGTLSVDAQIKTLYDFQSTTLEGSTFDFATLKGKKVLIVNTASKCGLTPQYETLEQLYKKYRDRNFVIIGFPANNFMKQEPGTDVEIRDFCTKNYGVTFPMMSKISVKGDDIDPLYKWLTTKSLNGVLDANIQWNFQKFMIDEQGNLVDFLAPKEQPDSEKLIKWIEGTNKN